MTIFDWNTIRDELLPDGPTELPTNPKYVQVGTKYVLQVRRTGSNPQQMVDEATASAKLAEDDLEKLVQQGMTANHPTRVEATARLIFFLVMKKMSIGYAIEADDLQALGKDGWDIVNSPNGDVAIIRHLEGPEWEVVASQPQTLDGNASQDWKLVGGHGAEARAISSPQLIKIKAASANEADTSMKLAITNADTNLVKQENLQTADINNRQEDKSLVAHAFSWLLYMYQK
ncbi:hypothetical protein QBC44DRAFT_328694 [Cladorrhinum sp. PSN332]|nr:hypothetical protein QBC44DRAFT_328694 [Cladorrhinum sp. PSN332]